MVAGFALSRTVGLPGYQEDGWEPPYGPLSLIVEVVFILAFAAWYKVQWLEASVTRERSRLGAALPE